MKSSFRFTKMHGLGNDFVLMDAISQRIQFSDLPALAIRLCDRNLGIGADGLVLIEESDHSDFKMRIWNADGSEPEMCGNAIRCFAKYVYQAQLTDKEVISVETRAGVIVPTLILRAGRVDSVEVDMGKPHLNPVDIPVQGFSDSPVVNAPITILDRTFNVTCVSMGNPHTVIFDDQMTAGEVAHWGSHIEHQAHFPAKTNVEFVKIISPDEIAMLVWERGAGQTRACGTGACAAVVAGVLTGQLNRKVRVHLPGGDLLIDWQGTDDHVIMTGPATKVFEGEIDL